MVTQTIGSYITDLSANITTANYPVASVAVGTLFFATDTGATYVQTATGPTLGSSVGSVGNKYSAVCTASPGTITATTGGAYYFAGYSAAPGSSTLGTGAAAGVTVLPCGTTTSFFAGEQVIVDGGNSKAEICTVVSIQGSTSLTLATATANAHTSGATVKGSYACITPKSTGRVRILYTALATGNNSTDTLSCQLVIGSALTTAQPASGAADTSGTIGTPVGNIASFVELTGVLGQSVECYALLGANAYATNTAPSGGAALTVGTPYWIDIVATSTTAAKTVILTNGAFVVEEI